MDLEKQAHTHTHTHIHIHTPTHTPAIRVFACPKHQIGITSRNVLFYLSPYLFTLSFSLLVSFCLSLFLTLSLFLSLSLSLSLSLCVSHFVFFLFLCVCLSVSASLFVSLFPDTNNSFVSTVLISKQSSVTFFFFPVHNLFDLIINYLIIDYSLN